MQIDFKNIKNKTFSSIPDGYDAFWLAELAKNSKNDILYIVADGRHIEQTAEILNYISPKTKILKFPAWDTVPYDRVSPNINIIAQRIETLEAIVQDPNPKNPRIIISSVSSTLQRLPLKKIFFNVKLEVNISNKLNHNIFKHYMLINGYNRVEQVIEPGEYAIRGDIIDIFPVGTNEPLRIDLFGDEVERIRTFDPMSQRTTGEIKSYSFAAMNEVALDENTIKTFRTQYREAFGAESMKDELYEAISSGQKYMGMENWLPLFYDESLPSIFDYLPTATVIIGRNVQEAIKSKLDSIMDYYLARQEGLKQKSSQEVDTYRPVKPENFYLNDEDIKFVLNQRQAAFLTSLSIPDDNDNINMDVLPGRDFSSAPPSPLMGEGRGVYQHLQAYLEDNKKLKTLIACYSDGSRERLQTLLKEHDISLSTTDSFDEALKANKPTLITLNIPHGFKGDGFCLISEQDILGEKIQRKPAKKATSKDFIADVSSLAIGELVVHIEHGIGKFLGLENITAGGAPHDCLKILYANDAKLFVPVENIDVISRYGIEDENIQLDTIGGSAWAVKKAKVKQKIKDIAEKLIKIAAQRQLKSGETFIPPQGLYEEFCSKFPFNETDDQLNAIQDVIEDLGKGVPMDRLVCGDVGFGKTEVALRAAFIVASSGAQVAIIAPTTLLARQHYYNFKKRMEGFPIKVKMLSRLVGAKETKKTKEEIASGAVEIVIGTHALLAKDIKFCNLGLLIIDEEQHFGVAHKEKLKSLKSDVHVLTLTATPIPRTLQLSLTGVKQLSIIATPPVDRLAVRTFVMPFDKVMIKEAIYREKFRNGQIFFVCPRVSDIFGIEKELKELVPDIKILAAHGQMPVTKLEEVMNDFADGKADMLLSTTIIESGIDMPTVNTMIIHRSDMFGLAQLYQLKGRIGRSKIRGYCYFTVPKKKVLKPIAERRLNILQALDTLGAGFSLASHDMDIRGSGNILGEEQSGHIKEVGISLYHHMLEEEIENLKAGEYKSEKKADWSPQISTGIPIMIPEAYVQDLGVRLGLYKRIGDIKDRNTLLDMKEELIDRFGKLPVEVDNLLKTVEIKHLCYLTNIEKIDAGAKGFLITFRNNAFQAADKLLELIQKSFGAIQIRHDQKIFISKDLSNYAGRIEAIYLFINNLYGMTKPHEITL